MCNPIIIFFVNKHFFYIKLQKAFLLTYILYNPNSFNSFSLLNFILKKKHRLQTVVTLSY